MPAILSRDVSDVRHDLMLARAHLGVLKSCPSGMYTLDAALAVQRRMDQLQAEMAQAGISQADIDGPEHRQHS